MMTGKVWLVGAGPGDIGLLTVKAVETIKDADLIVYDALIGDSLFSLFPEGAEHISVGKRSGNHTMPQEQIDKVLLDEALKGKKVVRLKGGDPFLFGRGGEELELLAANGVPYEIVPGVTSPIAVPAYNGIPVTHRDYTSSLHIITGHKRKGSDEDIDFEALVRAEGTLVFLMGIARLEYICGGLLGAGMNPGMPAAVLQQGTTAGQKRVVATVGTLAEEVRRQGIETPAIIIVGKVCSLADEFAWYEELPLAGSKVIVTRPRGMISGMAARLRRLGAEVLELPSIETVAREDQSELEGALDAMKSYSWIVFTSPTGVRVFFDVLKKAGRDVRSLAGVRIAAIGTGTK
ncbi:MAG: uroporphyrinogen-III C-methyltransferase, partial [Firmicutes bacterium]|nr:uroporphyrinogen-III C-methyltransferase [Bacillota bacterium]